MAAIFISDIRARFASLPSWQRMMFALAGLFILIWLVVVLWFLTKEQVGAVSELQIDKITHFIGGLFAAGVFFLISGARSRSLLIALIFALGILWEAWEVFFLPDQLIRFRSEFLLWFADSFFDLVADILGAYFFAELNKTPAIWLKPSKEIASRPL